MKRFFVLMLLVLTVCGCGDEGIENVLDPQSAPGAPAQADVVTEIPPHVQAFLFDRFGSREELIDRLINLDRNDKTVDSEFMANWLLRVISRMDQQRTYYQKYINAGGVAVVGNADVPDRYFIASKKIILQMTSKHPEIREKLKCHPLFGPKFRKVKRRFVFEIREVSDTLTPNVGVCSDTPV